MSSIDITEVRKQLTLQWAYPRALAASSTPSKQRTNSRCGGTQGTWWCYASAVHVDAEIRIASVCICYNPRPERNTWTYSCSWRLNATRQHSRWTLWILRLGRWADWTAQG